VPHAVLVSIFKVIGASRIRVGKIMMIRKALVAVFLTMAMSHVHAQTAVTHEITRTDTALMDVAFNEDGSVFSTNTFANIPANSTVSAGVVNQSVSGGVVSSAIKVEPYYKEGTIAQNMDAPQSDFGSVVAPPAKPPAPPMANGGTGQVSILYNFYDPNTKVLTGFGYVYFNYQNGVLISISTSTVPYTAPPPSPNFCSPGNPTNNPDCSY
jgi:hypothetical protein